MIEKKVKQIIIDIIEENLLPSINISSINDETILTDDLEFDSLNLAQLTVEIESEFDIDIFEDDVISTFGDIIKKLT